MASFDQTGRATPMSIADFNARAKRVAASTGAVEKGDSHGKRPNRFRRDVNGGISSIANEGKPTK